MTPYLLARSSTPTCSITTQRRLLIAVLCSLTSFLMFASATTLHAQISGGSSIDVAGGNGNGNGPKPKPTPTPSPTPPGVIDPNFLQSTGAQTWNSGANWDTAAVPNAIGEIVSFPTLTGPETVTLDAAITVGTLTLTNNNATAANLWTLSNGTGSLTLQVASGTASFTVAGTGAGTNVLSASVTLNSTTSFNITNTTAAGANGALNITGTLTGAGGVTKDGAGLMAFNTVTKAYTGATTINNGTLRLILAGKPTGTSGILVNSTGQLLLGSAGAAWGTIGTAGASITLNGTGPSSNGALRNEGTGTVSLANNISLATNSSIVTTSGAGTFQLDGIISGAGALTSAGGGTLKLTGPNTYTGKTSITAGTVSVASLNSVVAGTASSNLGAPTTVANGTIDIGSGATSGTTLLYTGTVNETTDRVINLAGTTGGPTIDQSGTAALKFTSDFTATGAGSKTLTLQGSTSGTGEISGKIVDNSGTNKTSVTKAGTGTWTLSGANTYTGATSVTAGKLFVNGSTSASSAVTVANLSGTVLGGSGTIGGSVTFSGAGTLAPGASGDGSTAKLTVGALTLASTSTFSLDLNGTTAGANYDQLIVSSTGTVTLGSATLSLNSISNLAVGNKLAILDNQSANAISGTFNGLAEGSSFSSGVYSFKIFYAGDASSLAESGGNDVILEVTAIPEPSTYVAAGLAVLGVGYTLRRRVARAVAAK